VKTASKQGQQRQNMTHLEQAAQIEAISRKIQREIVHLSLIRQGIANGLDPEEIDLLIDEVQTELSKVIYKLDI
jgi:hypothetical protein